ncbi:hypothetical protein BH012_10080 [Salmonella enterica]|nr:hypothetical protein [Salmonella enterica]EAX6601670.1 hypothetical protein [Salmonella enterica]
MYSTFRDIKNSAMPAWVTINEAVDIFNQKTNGTIKFSDICRFALHGYITLSIYFQSPVFLRRIVLDNNQIQTEKINSNDIKTRLCYLSSQCISSNDNYTIKTQGNYISPSYFIIDTALQGSEYAAVQTLLAHKLNLPIPVTGQHDIHYGVLVHDKDNILYQVFEFISPSQRIFQQLQHLPPHLAEQFYEILSKNKIDDKPDYFPVYQVPPDACFVIKYEELEQFIQKFFQIPTPPQKTATRISTPVSRLLWLACKHNDQINQLVDHPYKLLSVFEEWATHDGITDHLSGDTLKTALERGSPAAFSTSA